MSALASRGREAVRGRAAAARRGRLVARFGPWPHAPLPRPPHRGRRACRRWRADGRLGAATLRSLGRLARGYAHQRWRSACRWGSRSRALRLFRHAVKPVVTGLQALPSICWLPLALLWFGLSDTAILFVVVMGSVLAIAIATEDGVN